MKKNKKIIIMVIGILAVIALGFGVTYAWLTLTLNGTKNNVLKIGTLSLVLDDTKGEGINLQGAVPMLDEVGLAQEPYTFTLTNNGTVDSDYTIYFDDMDLETGEERLEDLTVLNYGLTKDGVAPEYGTSLFEIGEHPNRILESGRLKPGESHQYELRLWLSEYADNSVMGKVFRGKIRVEATQTGKLTSEECFTISDGVITEYDNTCPKAVVIPKTIRGVEVISIGENALSSKGLTSVIIPDSVISIGTGAFWNNQLTSLTLPNSIKSIGEMAFSDNRLTNVTLPNDITSIGGAAFAFNELTSITIPNTITSIEPGTFNSNQLTNIVIPESVTSIGEAAFRQNKLTSVTIPSSVINIDKEVLNDNQLPDSQAFIYARNSDGTEDKTTLVSYGGAKRNNVIIPDGVTTIGNSAFYANWITSVVIPSSVITIEQSAFSNNRLTSITIPNKVTDIKDGAFYANQLTTLTIPSSVQIIENAAFKQNQLTSVVIQGKSYASDFMNLEADVFGWASGYSDANITWNG